MLLEEKYTVTVAKDLLNGVKYMAKIKPDIIVVGQDNKKNQGLRLLRYMRDNVLKTPVVIVVSGGAGAVQAAAMKLGAGGVIEYPMEEDRLYEAITKAVKARKISFAKPPPITDEELNSNLSMLERKLNKEMKCFAGRNQVYIQSMVLGGRTSKPRICLKCTLRAEYGLNREVYYEFIRDVCCRNPDECEAVKQFKENAMIA